MRLDPSRTIKDRGKFGWLGRHTVKRKVSQRTMYFACQAIHYARHRLNHAFILDILRRDVLPVLMSNERLARITKFRLIRECAGIYTEHGRIREGLTLLYQIRDLTPPASERDQAGVLRRTATTEGGAKGLDNGAMDTLDEALQLAPYDVNFDISVRNSKAWLLIGAELYGKALDVLQSFAERYP